MRDLFDDIPEAVENTVEIAMRCFRPRSRAAMLPRFPPMQVDLEQKTKGKWDKELSGVGNKKLS